MVNDSPKSRILIVDDDEGSVRLLRASFQEEEFEVMTAFDGVEGLDLATKHVPDVIITGIVMPRMSGFEMMRDLQNNVATAHIPVLVYSHLGREDDRVQAERLGAREFLVRGMITPHEIIERARKVIARGKEYYLDFDPQSDDGPALRTAYNFKPYFECPDGSRMKLKLEPSIGTGTNITFRATFVCKGTKKE